MSQEHMHIRVIDNNRTDEALVFAKDLSRNGVH